VAVAAVGTRPPSPSIRTLAEAQRMGRVFVFALTAALNPTLLAAVTVMLTLPNTKRLLLGYLLGAAVTSVTCGLLLVFLLPGSSTARAAKHTVSPSIDIAVGVLILLVVVRVGRGRDRRLRAWSERRHEKAKNKPPPRWKRELSKGSARDTFIVGMLLSLPGASYLAGMDALHKQNIGTVATVLAVLAFNVIMLLLLELPLLAYAIRPESTEATVQQFKSWLSQRGARLALIGGAVIGIFLVTRGTIRLLS
jgi:Sap, sulfolipid-1-addressing protein